VATIYQIPLVFHEQGLDERVCDGCGSDDKRPDLTPGGRWCSA
jgi:CTP synthase (UTP-ammonia lyase)